jgi:hypothetical protein
LAREKKSINRTASKNQRQSRNQNVNGYVDDWMNIQLCEQEFVKESEDFIRWSIEMAWKERNQKWEIPEEAQIQIEEVIKERLKDRQWELPNQYLQTKEDEERWYAKNKKKFVLINGKTRGKSTEDRLGKVSY